MILRISVPVRVMLLLLFSSAVCAEIAPLTAYAPEAKAWGGQHLPFFVELRARGTFAGTASFDVPQLLRTLLMKIGDPVVGTRELEGESWFVQKHEFVLFSQEPGMLEVPAISVRYTGRHVSARPRIERRRARVTSPSLWSCPHRGVAGKRARPRL